MTDPAATAPLEAVLFDFSGTLFRLEHAGDWFAGPGGTDDVEQQVELMRRLTAPTGAPVDMTDAQKAKWDRRDLDPEAHHEAFTHVLLASGASPALAERLYARVSDVDSWTPYPDTAAVLRGLADAGIKVGVVSNIPFDLRPIFDKLGVLDTVGLFSLSFEVGAVKPNPAIFEHALHGLDVRPEVTLMVGDSEIADGGARALGAHFALVDPVPTDERPDGLLRAIAPYGLPIASGTGR
ncbi:HAD family hydrolase [Millisia brevis]|uniref:HAD family hydrolase n=1 Tax=Millisia brevis TaxID=264148 RepID=UPI000829AE4B|nr:HAD-IA family hydrolase [Millisia brevis]